jgi:hypothetical protein
VIYSRSGVRDRVVNASDMAHSNVDAGPNRELGEGPEDCYAEASSERSKSTAPTTSDEFVIMRRRAGGSGRAATCVKADRTVMNSTKKTDGASGRRGRPAGKEALRAVVKPRPWTGVASVWTIRFASDEGPRPS